MLKNNRRGVIKLKYKSQEQACDNETHGHSPTLNATPKKSSQSKFCMRSVPHSPQKIKFAKQSSTSLASQFPHHYQSMTRLKSFQRQRQQLDSTPQSYMEDYHELFMNTLDACDGSKYIYYDFQRHKKGYEGKSQYNRYIRGGNGKRRQFGQGLGLLGGRKQYFFDGKWTEKERLELQEKVKEKSTERKIADLGLCKDVYSSVQRKNCSKKNKSLNFECQQRRSVYHPHLTMKQEGLKHKQKQNFSQHKVSYSNFEILPIGYRTVSRNELLKRKRKTNQIVLKKMPHLFGRSKLSLQGMR